MVLSKDINRRDMTHKTRVPKKRRTYFDLLQDRELVQLGSNEFQFVFDFVHHVIVVVEREVTKRENATIVLSRYGKGSIRESTHTKQNSCV